MDSEELIRDPANRGLLSIDLLDFFPSLKVIELDVSSLFYLGLIAKEKEFKEELAKLDPTSFKQQAVALICSADTIIPTWVYMMLSEKLHTNAAYFDWKEKFQIELDLWKQNLQQHDFECYRNQKVVVKANPNIPASIYIEAGRLLSPVVQSLMMGDIGLPKVIFKRKINSK
ncbi:DUF2480 family protein [Algoriphagus sp. PAP.12]|uniref:DUF2480 family protein n=1 Tax=Algoriphagus sp. PAP.12 TaxID=2996678 RepID=UPI00227C9B59|nr:DUF2480 family protein [Algoriphagus sp. PAP.12]